jgi:hypothetical protein
VTGSGSVTLGDKPDWVLDLAFDTLNLENLLRAAVLRQQRQAAPPLQLLPLLLLLSLLGPPASGLQRQTASPGQAERGTQ